MNRNTLGAGMEDLSVLHANPRPISEIENEYLGLFEEYGKLPISRGGRVFYPGTGKQLSIAVLVRLESQGKIERDFHNWRMVTTGVAGEE